MSIFEEFFPKYRIYPKYLDKVNIVDQDQNLLNFALFASSPRII